MACIKNLGSTYRFLDFTGSFPYSIDHEINTVQFVKISSHLKSIFFLVLQASGMIIIISFYYGALDNFSFSYLKEHIGFSIFDFMTFSSSISIAILISIDIVIYYSRRQAAFHDCLKVFDQFLPILGEDIKTIRIVNKNLLIHILVYTITALVTPFGLYSFYREFTEPIGVSSTIWQWIIVIGASPTWLFGFLHPNLVGGYLLSLALISYLVDAFEKVIADKPIIKSDGKKNVEDNIRNDEDLLIDVIEVKNKLKDESGEEDTSLLLKQLSSLCQLQSQLDSLLGPLILLCFGIFFVISVVLFYIVTTFFFGKLPLSRILQNTFCLVVGILYLHNLLTLCSAGERLKSVRNKARKKLQDLALKGKANRTCHKLIDDLDHEHTLAPMGYFELNRSTFISLMGSLSTYLVVLVQFKATE